MPDEGIGRCDHDTPSEIHNRLWRIYDDHTQGARPRVEVKLGPYEEELPDSNRRRAWVIINLSRDDMSRAEAETNANLLKDELNKVPGTEATFKVLRKASPVER